MKSQRGFTLVEVMVSMAILGVIVGSSSAILHQFVTVPEYGNESVTAMHELQNVAHWFNIDGQMSVSATGGSQLVLKRYDNVTITYAKQGTDLNRVAGSSNRTLAQNITDIDFAVQGRLVTMDITSSPSGRWGVSQNGTYEVYLRPVP